MAARELIHFSVCVQLDRGATIQASPFRDSTASTPGSPPHLPDSLPARRNNTAPTADGGLYV
jgi:hypothetical protein